MFLKDSVFFFFKDIKVTRNVQSSLVSTDATINPAKRIN